MRDWFTPAERDLVGSDAGGRTVGLLANLVWSAKESALKVLQTGLRRDTRSVEVDVVEHDGARALGPARRAVAEEGSAFPGWWRRYGDFVLTVAADADFASAGLDGRAAPPGRRRPPRTAGSTSCSDRSPMLVERSP